MSVCVNPVAVILENHSFGYRKDVKSLFFHTFLKPQSLRFCCRTYLSGNSWFLWLLHRKSCIIMGKNQRLKVHRQWLPGRSLCSIRSNRKWCKRRGSSLECQNCFFVYPIIDSNLKNLYNSSLTHVDKNFLKILGMLFILFMQFIFIQRGGVGTQFRKGT